MEIDLIAEFDIVGPSDRMIGAVFHRIDGKAVLDAIVPVAGKNDVWDQATPSEYRYVLANAAVLLANAAAA